MANDTLQDIRDQLAAGIQDSLDAIEAAIGGTTVADALALATKREMGAVPATATPFAATSAVITSVTPVLVKAAVSSKKKWITHIKGYNGTSAEIAVLVIEDDTGTPIEAARLFLGDPAVAGQGSGELVCRPPIEIAAGKKINARATGSLGDSFVTVLGFEEA